MLARRSPRPSRRIVHRSTPWNRSERGIITKMEVDAALERAVGAERGPAAAAHVVALVGALPRELNARPAITIRVAAVEFSRHHDEAQSAEAVLTGLDEAGLDQIDGLLIPVVHLGDTPPAHDACSRTFDESSGPKGLPGGPGQRLTGSRPGIRVLARMEIELSRMLASVLRRAVAGRRDDVVRAAVEAGLSKVEVHRLTGIARTTIDRIVGAAPAAAGASR